MIQKSRIHLKTAITWENRDIMSFLQPFIWSVKAVTIILSRNWNSCQHPQLQAMTPARPRELSDWNEGRIEGRIEAMTDAAVSHELHIPH